MFKWSSSVLNPEPASDIICLEESGAMSRNDSVGPVELAFIIFQDLLSTLGSNEDRAAAIIHHHVTIPSGIDLDHCTTHPEIT